MTFPGESLPVWDYGNTSGAPIPSYDAVTYRAGVSTFTSGEEAWVDVDLFPLILAPGDDAVVSWVLEVASGSGVFDLSEDAGSLGSHTVSAGTLVVGSSLTAADVIAGGMARLTIACTAGTVEVQQVKLRVWPPTGAVGAWSAPYQPPTTTSEVNVRRSPAVLESDTLTAATGTLAMHDEKQQLAGVVGGISVGTPLYDFTFSPTWLGSQFFVVATHINGATGDDGGAIGSAGASVLYVERDGDPFVPDPPGVYGVDWLYPPNEVPDDPDGWDVVGDDEWGWWQGVATVIADNPTDGPPFGTFRVGADHVDDVDDPATLFNHLFATAGIVQGIRADSVVTKEFDLPPIGEDGLTRLVLWHDGLVDPDSVSNFTVYSSGADYQISTGNASARVERGRYIDDVFHPIQASYTAGAYRYWTLTPAVVSKVRQFHRDDGLGVTPPRAFGGASRIRTGRAYGYD